MALKPAQKTALKAYILADPALAAMTSGPSTDFAGLANLMNQPSDPAVSAWRTNVSPADIDDSTPWTNFDSIQPAGKRDSYLHAFLKFNRDFSRNKVRKWVTDVWGNATAGSDAETILIGAGVETALRGEVAIGGTVKSTNNVSALDRSYVGTVSTADIAELFL